MSAALSVRVALTSLCLALPAAAWAQGSARLLAAEQQWDDQVGIDQRIIGGTPVRIADNPWQVGILAARVPSNQVAQFCGGSIIAARWVVTAAHCVDKGTLPERIHILAGTDSLQTGGTRLAASRIIVHESWDPATSNFDIALIEVASDLIATIVGGAVVAGDTSAAEQPTTLQVRVTGWGRTSKSTQIGSKTLQGIEIPYVARATCNRPPSYDGSITDNMICAGVATGGVDSCQGDSGGPATAVVDGTRRLVGIVSWGQGCALRNKYGVYTNVSKFRTWVSDKTAGTVTW